MSATNTAPAPTTAPDLFTPPRVPRGRPKFELQQKVVLLILTFRAPGNERTIKDKSIVKTGANLANLHVSKRLLECPEYRDIAIHDGRTRDYVDRIALPSPFKAGTYVIPISMIGTVDETLIDFANRRGDLVERFARVYNDAKNQARAELAELFREDEYLTLDALRAAYRLEWQYVTLAAPDQLKALNAEVFEREKARLQSQWDDAIDTMRDALRAGLTELVNDMVARLSDGDKKFKPTKLLERFTEFLDTFDARNITDDDDLAALAQQARTLLNGVDTDTLKKSPEVRAQVFGGFQVAKAQLAELETTAKKARRISFDDE